MINKSPDSYGIKSTEKRSDKSVSLDGKEKEIEILKGIPQHIKAAKQLVEIGKQIKTGDIISYVKTRTLDGVKPVALANQMDIDTEKYLESMESTFDQILSSLNLNFKSIIGKPRQTNLDELFWN
jgi:DNA polymerase I